jgi:hypothetical protein
MPIDVQQLRDHLSDSSGQTAVLKAHLWVETMLNGLIAVTLAKPDALDFDRMAFAQKVNLALASGGLQESIAPCVKALNKLRNKLAHQLDADATDESLDALAGHVDGTLSLESMHLPTTDARTRFRGWVVVHLLALEWHRMRLEWRRDHQEQLQRFELQVGLLRFSGHEPSAEKLAELQAQWQLPPEPTYRDALENWPEDSFPFTEH